MYNFKINKIETNDGSIILPKQINIIIGPNNCGKSQFLKDIKNSLHNNGFGSKKNIIIKKMEYYLPKNKEEFIDRYNLEKRIFKQNNNQFYIRNYSGLNNLDFKVHSGMSFNNYFDIGKINIYNDWKNNLEIQISNFEKPICYNEKILSQGDFSEKAIIHNITYVEDEKDGEKTKTQIEGGDGPLYAQARESIDNFINTYGELFYNFLGTEEKLLMCKAQKKYGLQDGNTNFLSEVQFNNELLKKLSIYTRDMFKKDIYLDKYTYGEVLLFRVGDDFDFIRNSPRENSEVEIKLNDYNLLDDEGDGLKSFVTTYLSLNLNDKNILLFDEPETFLHPPLAKQLGEIIGKAANENKQIFLSTHSADLLKGILNSNSDVKIIRITRNEDTNNISQLDEISNITNDSLLYSSNVLNGLFCEKVYISESESDEEFYRCLHDKVNPTDSSFFTHGENKQTLGKIAKIYNDLNVLNYRIYDFDLLFDKAFNSELNKFISDDKKNAYINLSKQIKKVLIEKELYHNGGISAIQDNHLRNQTQEMLTNLKKNGIIILKKGCLETCLLDYKIAYTKNNKKNWVTKAIKFINNSDTDIIKNSNIYNWLFR